MPIVDRPMPASDKLPYALYRADQVRELDRIAIQECGIPGVTLMERAGQAAFPTPQRTVISLASGQRPCSVEKAA